MHLQLNFLGMGPIVLPMKSNLVLSSAAQEIRRPLRVSLLAMFLISFAPSSLDAHLVRDTSVGGRKETSGPGNQRYEHSLQSVPEAR
jgi:hypothetical protein